MNEKNNYWYQLKDDFIDFLREKGYGKSSFTHYRGQIDFLIRYANALGYTEYSPEIGQAFLESEARLREWNPKALNFKATVIRRLDEYINGRNYTFARLRIFYQCPEGFESGLEAFLQTLRDGGYKEITIRQYRTQLVKMLRCFSENGITSWEDVNAACVQQAFGKSANRAIFATYARKFFAYLVEQGITAANYSGMFYGCGLRLGEALALRWENVDIGTGILHIRKAKNDKECDVPMDPSLTSLLEMYKKRRLSETPDSVYVFESDRIPGTPYLGWTFRNWFPCGGFRTARRNGCKLYSRAI